IVLVTGLTLLTIVLVIRGLLIHDVEEGANATIQQEIGEFTSFAQDGIDPATGAAFTDVTALLEVYLSRQHPALGEVLIGVPPSGAPVLHQDNTRLQTEAGERYHLAADADQLNQILDAEGSSGVLETEHGQVHW